MPKWNARNTGSPATLLIAGFDIINALLQQLAEIGILLQLRATGSATERE